MRMWRKEKNRQWRNGNQRKMIYNNKEMSVPITVMNEMHTGGNLTKNVLLTGFCTGSSGEWCC